MIGSQNSFPFGFDLRLGTHDRRHSERRRSGMQRQIWPDSRTVRRRPRQTVAHIPTRFRRPPGFRSTIYQLDFPSRYGAGDRAHSERRFDVRTSDRFIAQPRDQCGVYINPRQSRQKTRYFSSSKACAEDNAGRTHRCGAFVSANAAISPEGIGIRVRSCGLGDRACLGVERLLILVPRCLAIRGRGR